MTILYILLGAVSAMYILWVFYLAVMNLKRARDNDTMTPFAKFLGYGIVVPGVILDALVNITIGSIIFLEFPHYKRLLLTARLSYHYEPGSDNWRSKLAEWFARNLLNTYDPSGKHVD